jgi:probable F420-dependent oxidoreductase
VRIGCDLPYFPDAGAIRAFAQAAEELGYDHLAFSEHVASALDSPFPAGFVFEDPWHEAGTMLAFLAGCTSRIELMTSMMLLPLRPTVLAAKQVAEADLLSGGRVRLGVAVGWNTSEVRALDVDAATRGARFDEQVELLRLLWTEPAVTYHGRFHNLDGVGIHPRPGRSIPIWMGAGNFDSGGVPTDRALRRIARLADGYKMFAPLGSAPDQAREIVERLHKMARDEGRDPAALGVEARLITQSTPPEQWAEVASSWAATGASHLGLGNRIAGGTVDDQIALIERVSRVVFPAAR